MTHFGLFENLILAFLSMLQLHPDPFQLSCPDLYLIFTPHTNGAVPDLTT